MTEKLKPCPFCGGEAKTKHEEDNTSLIIYCPTCSRDWNLKEEAPGERWAADFDFCGWGKEDDGAAIAAWNRRAIDRDALLKIADDLDSSWAEFFEELIACEDVDKFEQSIAARIRKAVGE